MGRLKSLALGILTGSAFAWSGFLYLHLTPDDAPVNRWIAAQLERTRR